MSTRLRDPAASPAALAAHPDGLRSSPAFVGRSPLQSFEFVESADQDRLFVSAAAAPGDFCLYQHDDHEPLESAADSAFFDELVDLEGSLVHDGGLQQRLDDKQDHDGDDEDLLEST